MTIPDTQIRFLVTFDAIGNQACLPLAGIWHETAAYLRHHGCCPSKVTLNTHREDGTALTDEALTPEMVFDKLASHHYGGFQVDTLRYQRKTFHIQLGISRHTEHPPKLEIVADATLKFPTAWNKLIESVAVLFPIRLACQYRFIYKRWQGASRLDNWKPEWGAVPAYKQTTEHLPGFERPWVWMDNSLNPGRTIEVDFNAYRVDSEMWLGPGFWSYAPCTKEEVLAADFFIEKRDTAHYLYLKSWPHPFTRPDGEQGRVQQKLWRLLYKQDCEWPPGSGGISDVPVDGPPELMP